MMNGKLNIITGNIVDDNILKLGDVIVNPTNPMMRMGWGVSMAIYQKAGADELERYTEQRFGISYADETRKNEMKPTEIRVTPGFKLPCDIIFAQSPNLTFYSDENIGLAHLLLYKTYQNLLKFAKNHGYKNILLPSLGTGHYGFSHSNVAQNVVRILEEYADAYDINIFFVLFDEETANIYKQYMGMCKKNNESETQLYRGIFG